MNGLHREIALRLRLPGSASLSRMGPTHKCSLASSRCAPRKQAGSKQATPAKKCCSHTQSRILEAASRGVAAFFLPPIEAYLANLSGNETTSRYCTDVETRVEFRASEKTVTSRLSAARLPLCVQRDGQVTENHAGTRQAISYRKISHARRQAGRRDGCQLAQFTSFGNLRSVKIWQFAQCTAWQLAQ